MSKCISKAMSDNEIIPGGIVSKFNRLMKRCEEDIY
jgi:hypothetical protein